MDVFWLEQSEADVPIADDWLSVCEAVRLSSLRIPKRRADWRLGRWTAKCAVAASLRLPADNPVLKDIQIRAAETGEPEVTLPDKTVTVTISISHCAGTAICAVALGKVALGCDLEAIESRSDAFVADYFTPEEQELIAQSNAADRSRVATLLWSAKESALKALHVGLRVDTRSVIVSLFDPQGERFARFDGRAKVGYLSDVPCSDWWPLLVRCADGTMFQGWWRHAGDLVQTLVASPPSIPPVELRAPVRAATTEMPS